MFLNTKRRPLCAPFTFSSIEYHMISHLSPQKYWSAHGWMTGLLLHSIRGLTFFRERSIFILKASIDPVQKHLVVDSANRWSKSVVMAG